jgi:single-strand DNA-binding protein
MTVTGKIHLINEIQEITESFSKREFVIETSENYPQFVILELHKSSVDLIDPYNLGDEVMVSINIRGKAYDKPLEKTKYFNTLVAWKIQKL